VPSSVSVGAPNEGFDLGAQAVAAPDALLLGLGTLVGGFHGVERFCKPGLTIVAALNDVLRNAREVQAEKACCEIPG
jgi:anaerobic glycerol-3-phosphate dehydrogenase